MYRPLQCRVNMSHIPELGLKIEGCMEFAVFWDTAPCTSSHVEVADVDYTALHPTRFNFLLAVVRTWNLTLGLYVLQVFRVRF
jgi:hypothetical protein